MVKGEGYWFESCDFDRNRFFLSFVFFIGRVRGLEGIILRGFFKFVMIDWFFVSFGVGWGL